MGYSIKESVELKFDGRNKPHKISLAGKRKGKIRSSLLASVLSCYLLRLCFFFFISPRPLVSNPLPNLTKPYPIPSRTSKNPPVCPRKEALSCRTTLHGGSPPPNQSPKSISPRFSASLKTLTPIMPSPS
ncbi:hypothetical protein LINGRAHAP2_LOCUS35171 [Linum grandiflorum]